MPSPGVDLGDRAALELARILVTLTFLQHQDCYIFIPVTQANVQLFQDWQV